MEKFKAGPGLTIDHIIGRSRTRHQDLLTPSPVLVSLDQWFLGEGRRSVTKNQSMGHEALKTLQAKVKKILLPHSSYTLIL